ncbi:MAG: RsmE family RNA methyltransferase [Chloroflexota bacterium]
MMTHRFFIPTHWITPPTVAFEGDVARQIRKVLRMQPGQTLAVLDNTGREWQVQLTEVRQDLVRGRIIGQGWAQGEPRLHLTLYQGSLKAQKFELILQQGTELGISRFVPTVCRRSVVSDMEALDKKQERWQRIIKEAAEVNGRGLLPQLEPAMPFEQAVRHAYAAPLRIMLWEEAAGFSLKTALAQNRAGKVALFIGPEGGFTAEEAGLARQLGCQVVGLGPRILRAETAGLVAAAAIFYELGDWD